MRKSTAGFTIVELLVVIIVIGILAAISIVAYGGIQRRANETSAKHAVGQAAKAIEIYAIDNNSQYPTSLANAGITNGGGTTYQYYANNAPSNRLWCVSATVGGRTFHAKSDTKTATEGPCARVWAAQGQLATTANCSPHACYYLAFNVQSFPAGNYQVRCRNNSGAIGATYSRAIPANGYVQLNCYFAGPANSPMTVEIVGWGISEPVSW